MDKKPTISVIMSVYNTEKYLDECIQSILSQTYTDFEFIISDDGSTDRSKEIIKKYAEKDKRIIFLDNKKNRWISANLNDCLDKAKWNYIAIMESDDICYPRRFQIEIDEMLKDNNLMLLWTNWEMINGDGDKIWVFEGVDYEFKKSKSYYLTKVFTFSASSVIFRANTINIINKKFESSYIRDFIFYSYIICNWLKCKNIPEILIKKRDIPEALHEKKAIKIQFLILKQRLYFIKKYKLFKEDRWIKLKSLYLFFSKSLISSFIYITKILWIYTLIKPLYRKYILKK